MNYEEEVHLAYDSGGKAEKAQLLGNSAISKHVEWLHTARTSYHITVQQTKQTGKDQACFALKTNL